ncbi:MAG: type I-G CRISPR-associated protein Csb2 [Acidimicrobiales bacterium]
MTVTLGFRFPLGRYHATPWGRQVNEGTVEWPPSPWRILRALYATWRYRAPEIDGAVVRSILGSLVDAPSYRLPRHAETHTRHYMPDHLDGPAKSTDKVFDPFIVVAPDQEILVRWPCTLTAPEEAALSRLCEALPYLGRAESVCDARVVPEADVPSEAAWAEPGSSGTLREPPSRVLVPRAPFDEASLLARSADVRRKGRTSPPGSRWVPYAVAPASTPPPMSRAIRPPPRVVEAVVLRLDGKVLPGLRDTVLYGHVLRQAAQSSYGDPPSPTLSGRPPGSGIEGATELAAPEQWRQDGHSHAHYLVVDADGDRLLDSAIVWAPEGMPPRVIAALHAISRLHSGIPGFRPLRVFAAAAGDVADLRCGSYVSAATRWTSVTPFVPYRHRKRRQSVEEFVAREVQRELVVRGLPSAAVELVPGDWLSFRRARLPADRPAGPAFGLRLTFDGPLPSARPLSLGQLSHFGLGLFSALAR